MSKNYALSDFYLHAALWLDPNNESVQENIKVYSHFEV